MKTKTAPNMDIENRKNNKNIMARKITLLIDAENNNKLKEAFNKLYGWQKVTFRAANIIVAHLYCQEQIKEFAYFNDDKHLQLTDNNKYDEGVLNTSRENCTYRMIAKHYKTQIPTAISSLLNHSIYSTFKKELKEYQQGNRSLRSYRKDIPVPFPSRAIHDLRYDPKINNFRFSLFKSSAYKIPLKTRLGRDGSDNKSVLLKCIKGEFKIRSSSYIIKGRKITLSLIIETPSKMVKVDPNRIINAQFSFLSPVILSINNKEIQVGDSSSFFYRRKAIQNGLVRRKRALSENKGGRGRKQKLKNIEEFRQKEKNFVNTYMHKISSEIVKHCLNYNAGSLVLQDDKRLTDEAKESPLILRNWSYGNLKDKIEYKCKLNNIRLITN